MNLKTVSIKGSKIKKIGANAFAKTNKNITFKVNKKTTEEYKELLKDKAPSTYTVK